MNNTSDDYLNCRGNMSNASMILFVILNFFSGLAAFSGNTLVLVAVYYLRGHRKPSHYFLASLAVADLSVGVIMNPVLASKAVLSIWQGEHWLSKTADFMWLQTTTATALSLCAVSYDRYAAIRGVFSYQSLLTRPRAILIILTIWLFSILIGTSRLFVRNPNAHSVLWISSTLLTVIIPLLLIAYCYTKIYTAAKIQRQKIAENALTRKQTRNSLKNKKAAYTVGIVIGVFVVLWIPSFAASVAEMIVPHGSDMRLRIDHAWFWIALLAYSSSGANPWIYSIRMREFRSVLRRKVLARHPLSRYHVTGNAMARNGSTRSEFESTG